MYQKYTQRQIPGILTDFPTQTKSTEFPRCEKLRKYRLSAGLTQADLATRVAMLGGNVGSVYISRFECGLQRPWKSARYWLAIALDVDEVELFESK